MNIVISMIICYTNQNPQKVLLMPCKDNRKYKYINLTKGHICKCEFDTIKEALEDLKKYKNITDIKMLIKIK